MSFRRTHNSVASMVLGIAFFAAPGTVLAAPGLVLSGALGGVVTNAAGAPQLGATVTLYNHLDRAFDKTLTDERGEFKFLGLFPDVYSVRVTLATFVPALRKDILVQSGMYAVLNVNLNTLFSSIQIAYPSAADATFMTDDWKWMLRSASSTRPVLRFLGDPLAKPPVHSSRGSVFSDTRGLVQLSGGDGPMTTGAGTQADLGTGFALATSIYGANHVELSGNLGYSAQTGVPAAAIRTAYSRSPGSGPELSVTMRQLFVPGHDGDSTSQTALPMLRSVSASFDDRTQLTDEASLQYGLTMDSVSIGEHIGYLSPYARLVYSLDDQGEVAFAYTSGNARPDLGAGASGDAELQRDLGAVGLFPRVSLLNGHPQIQRGQEFEFSYSRKIGTRTVTVSAYRERVTNAALTVAGPTLPVATDNLLPDLLSGNAIFNGGDYSVFGYTASVTQPIGQNITATVSYGTVPALNMSAGQPSTGSPDELRSMLHAAGRQAAAARVAATAPATGTHVIASYQWVADTGWLTLGNMYSTQSVRPLPGLNVFVRQPVPWFSSMSWRVEATADLCNLLADGYLPVATTTGQQFVLVQTPRSFRGGLNFIF
jgi:hypothetical protein